MKIVRHYPLSILTILAITALSLLPIGPVEVAEGVPMADKWTHMVMYAGLTAVICWEKKSRGQGSKVKGRGFQRLNVVRQVHHESIFPLDLGRLTLQERFNLSTFQRFNSPLLFAIALGGLMELLQAYCTTYRSGEWLDLLADSIGALAGWLIACLSLSIARGSA